MSNCFGTDVAKQRADWRIRPSAFLCLKVRKLARLGFDLLYFYLKICSWRVNITRWPRWRTSLFTTCWLTTWCLRSVRSSQGWYSKAHGILAWFNPIPHRSWGLSTASYWQARMKRNSLVPRQSSNITLEVEEVTFQTPWEYFVRLFFLPSFSVAYIHDWFFQVINHGDCYETSKLKILLGSDSISLDHLCLYPVVLNCGATDEQGLHAIQGQWALHHGGKVVIRLD